MLIYSQSGAIILNISVERIRILSVLFIGTVRIRGTWFMKKAFALLLCVVLTFGLVSCGKSEDAETNDGSETNDTDIADSSDNTKDPPNYRLSEFDDDLISYLCLNGYDYSNFIISPTAFRASLCLAASGAQGNTRAELVSAAGFSGIDATKAWYARLKNSETFSVANSVWNNQELLGEFTDSFTSNVKNDYDADAYSYKSDELTKAINDWINQKTNGMIPTAADDLAGASSVLVNTLNLRAAWENAFSQASINNGEFVDIFGNKQNMDFMEQTAEYLYTEESGTKVLVIPMEGNLSFVCFLGNRTGMFDKMTSLQKEKVHVVLPKFELESIFDSRDLLGFLLSRGVTDAISESTANFYNMCKGTDWFIQEIIQKTKITTDESGIGSVTASSESDATGSEEDAEVNEFIADRPFSFAVFSDFGANSQHMLLYGQLMTSE